MSSKTVAVGWFFQADGHVVKMYDFLLLRNYGIRT